jgi:hypothetical protein
MYSRSSEKADKGSSSKSCQVKSSQVKQRLGQTHVMYTHVLDPCVSRPPPVFSTQSTAGGRISCGGGIDLGRGRSAARRRLTDEGIAGGSGHDAAWVK